MPELEGQEVKALRAIYSRGMIRGRDIGRIANIPVAQLGAVLNKLQARRFVTLQTASMPFSGSSAGTEILDAYVAPLPSRRADAEAELKSGG